MQCRHATVHPGLRNIAEGAPPRRRTRRPVFEERDGVRSTSLPLRTGPVALDMSCRRHKPEQGIGLIICHDFSPIVRCEISNSFFCRRQSTIHLQLMDAPIRHRTVERF